ncbi:MAG: ArnT family glycosyltransferase [Alphaproteobacteria bacterium]
MQRLLTGVRPYLALTFLCLLLYLPGLSGLPPMDRDESRFAQATRQMLETGDFVTIHYQDTMRTKKPVGIYWLQSAAVSMFGDAEGTEIWPYRLPSVLGAWIAVLGVFHFGRTMFGRQAAFLAAALLASSMLLVAEAHQAKTDAVLLACTVVAQGALGRAYLRELGKVPVGLGVALAFWLAQGVGILVKGPLVPLVSLLTFLALWIVDRRVAWFLGLRPLLGLLVVTAMVVPWGVAISKATGGTFLGEAVRSDLLPKLLGAQEMHGAPPGYYLLLVTLTLWPGSLLLWPALVRAFRRRRDPAVRLCLAWAGPAWIVFELVPTKLPHYVLPTYPALCLLLGAGLLVLRDGTYELLSSRPAAMWYAVWGVLGVGLAIGLGTAPGFLGPEAGTWTFTPWVLPTVVGALVAGVGPILLLRDRKFLQAVWTSIAGAVIVHITAFTLIAPDLDALWLSSRVETMILEQVPDPQGAVAAAGFHEPSLVFHLGTDTLLTDGPGAARHILAHPGALAVVGVTEQPAFHEQLRAMGRPVDVLGTVDGFNYSRGRRETLGLYRAAPSGG